MRPLADRNQVSVGLVTLVVIALLVLAANFSDHLPLVGTGTTYAALFKESAGLRAGDRVDVAGVKVGEVRSVELDKGKARVAFTVNDTRVGAQSTLSIQIATVLGQKTLALDVRGTDPQPPGTTIPVNRTTSPYDVQQALEGLGRTTGDIDSQNLAKAFDVAADTFDKTPDSMRGALNGLTALSKTIASRDEALRRLVNNTSQVSKTVADRNDEVQRMLSDGGKLLSELQQRKKAIDALLDGTRGLAQQLSGLVDDNNARLKPALTQLNRLTTILSDQQDNLGNLVHNLAPYIRMFTNTVGSGRWFDGYMCGLLSPINDQGNGNVINPDGCSAPQYDPSRVGVTPK
ncbi:MCE family protein [Sciscionella sediminilitoris]|uniref:MCE family protein n=1 Tax=Sciscionella sediminilitoris TaxID=1445613 RepID=UPI0004DF5167|nr:MCE family protein [Sciscionella sp. SE31]